MASKIAAHSHAAALALLTVLIFPAASHAAKDCAWMTEATASGLLGSDAVGAFTKAASGQPAVCLFTSDSQGVKRTLRITVEIVQDAHARVGAASQNCGSSPTSLKAIGNEAFACPSDERKGVIGERATGRVRDQFFTIAIASTAKDDPILTRQALETRIYTAAEQVAGNLF